MPSYVTDLQANLSVPFTYPVHFTESVFSPEHPLLQSILKPSTEGFPVKIGVVLDSGLVEKHPSLTEQIKSYFLPQSSQKVLVGMMEVPGGETCKNDPQVLQQLYQFIHENKICRHSYLLAIGGGALLDVVGYAAATAHRGIRLIRLPTTVLSQNDSGIGVKNSINAFQKKNFLGTFCPPHAVINDFNFLVTLDDRDWRAGMAEAIKIALLKDTAFFEWMESHLEGLRQRDMSGMKQLIGRCAALHLEHITSAGDPFEQGNSRPLDFGHWVAHKLESLSDYSIRHGEAVALGILTDSAYSHAQGWLPTQDWLRISQLISQLGFLDQWPLLETTLKPESHPQSLFRGLSEFREHLGGRLTLSMLTGIGSSFEVHHIEPTLYQSTALALGHCLN